jgi:hypothetical protein
MAKNGDYGMKLNILAMMFVKLTLKQNFKYFCGGSGEINEP